MIDGATSQPFNALTFSGKLKIDSLKEKTIELSRKNRVEKKNMLKRKYFHGI